MQRLPRSARSMRPCGGVTQRSAACAGLLMVGSRQHEDSSWLAAGSMRPARSLSPGAPVPCLGHVVRAPGEKTCLGHVVRAPGEKTCLGHVVRAPGEKTCLGHVLAWRWCHVHACLVRRPLHLERRPGAGPSGPARGADACACGPGRLARGAGRLASLRARPPGCTFIYN